MGGPSWLARARAQAALRLEGLAVPTEAEEIWRYSGIDHFDQDRYGPASAATTPSVTTDEALDRARRLADALGPRSALVVTTQGQVAAVELEPGAPSGLVAEPDTGAWLETGADAFSVMHDAYVPSVVTVTVPDAAVLAHPVVVVHLVDAAPGPDGEAPACFPHTTIRVGERADAGVIELTAPTTDGADDGDVLVVPVTDIDVDGSGRLSYANLQVLGPGAFQVALQRSRVESRGSLRSFTVSLGGRYARVRTDSDLRGEGANGSLLAAYLGTGEQVHDFRTLQDHNAARTESELLFTGAVGDRSRSVYSGLIRIRRGARRADARQTNNNLVLSEGAHADSVPNLDIDENDVRCSHASTVGPIDEEHRYYLESRGIEPAVAERLIVLGFFADLADRSPFAAVGQWVTDAVAERLQGRLPAETSGGRHG